MSSEKLCSVRRLIAMSGRVTQVRSFGPEMSSKYIDITGWILNCWWMATVPILFQIKLRVPPVPRILGTGTERNSIPYFMQDRHTTQQEIPRTRKKTLF